MEESTEEICVVCQHSMDGETATATTSCNHRLHSSCLLSAAQSSDVCPVCRTSLYPDSDTRRRLEIEISSDDLGEEVMGSIRREVSRLAQAMSFRDDDDDVHIIDVESTPPVTRGRRIHDILASCREGDLIEVRRMINRHVYLDHAEDDEMDTLLHASVFSENEQLVRYLLSEVGLSPNSINRYRMTPLHYAASTGCIRIATLLLNNGASVDCQDQSGKTPLMTASRSGQSQVVQLLVDKGASARTFDSSGDTSLHYAARGKCLGVIRLLIRESNNVDALNHMGETALHLACIAGSFTAVRFLLDGGADPNIRDKSGKKPSEFVSRDNSRLRRILTAHT